METRIRGLSISTGHSIAIILRIMLDNTICSHARTEKVRVLGEASCWIGADDDLLIGENIELSIAGGATPRRGSDNYILGGC
jgi:hypothetical protein